MHGCAIRNDMLMNSIQKKERERKGLAGKLLQAIKRGHPLWRGMGENLEELWGQTSHLSQQRQRDPGLRE